MAETQSNATPLRLARISGVQAIGTLAETLLFGIIGLFFSLFGLVLFEEISGNGLLEYLASSPGIGFYFLASGAVYVSLLTAVRVGNKSGVNALPQIESEDSDSLIDQIYDNILSVVIGSSYTAGIIGIGAIITYEAAQLSPVLAMISIAGYPYIEHYAVVSAAEVAEAVDDVDVILTPAIVATAMIMIVPTIMISPILVSLRLIGLVASITTYLPSFSGMGQSIRATQEHLVIIDWLSPKQKQRMH